MEFVCTVQLFKQHKMQVYKFITKMIVFILQTYIGTYVSFGKLFFVVVAK